MACWKTSGLTGGKMAVLDFFIVEHFDVIEDIDASHFSCFVDTFVYPALPLTAKE